MSSDSPVNQETVDGLHELMEDEFNALVESFLEDTTRLLDSIETAAGSGDADALSRDAHALKSSSANMGALGVSDYARQMEFLGKEGLLGNSADLIARVKEEFDRAREILTAQIASWGPARSPWRRRAPRSSPARPARDRPRSPRNQRPNARPKRRASCGSVPFLGLSASAATSTSIACAGAGRTRPSTSCASSWSNRPGAR